MRIDQILITNTCQTPALTQNHRKYWPFSPSICFSLCQISGRIEKILLVAPFCLTRDELSFGNIKIHVCHFISFAKQILHFTCSW